MMTMSKKFNRFKMMLAVAVLIEVLLLFVLMKYRPARYFLPD